MQILQCTISILQVNSQQLECLVKDKHENTCIITYVIKSEEILGSKENQLFEQILHNSFQFKKVVRSAIRGNISSSNKIEAVFIEGFPFLEEDAFYKFVLMEQRSGNFNIEVRDALLGTIPLVFADGSYMSKTGKSGFGGFIEWPDGKRQVFSKTLNRGSSNLMELLAVTEGLKLLKAQEEILIHTDSRFVIRGLIQWVHFWRLNNWQTSHGHEVKYRKYWQQIDELCRDKLIVFKWIKGHSGNQNQDFCHRLAQESANKKNDK